MCPALSNRSAEPSAQFLRLPTVFGRFLLLKRLSRGGMGEIFLSRIGEIEGFEKLVIIKKILPSLVENQDFIARFIDEAQVAIKLNHANIAAVYEVGRVEGEYFLTLEYVEGRDLRRLMQRCRERQIRLPVDLCLYLCRELVSGLAYAHRRTDERGQPLSLVHCDISPPNVMVSFEGEVKIIDFGIARSALRTAGSNPNMGFGKFGYMAPEQLLRGGVIDRRTDIYAAGVVLYELLTGERLYQFPEGADYKQIARMVCQGQFLAPSQRDPSLDPALDGLVCRALATQKEARYQIAEEFRDALQQQLYQMNPTISADSLALVMAEMFGGELERDRQELAQMRAVDVGAYQEELAGSVNHTVTFARAGLAQAMHLQVPALPSGPPASPATQLSPQPSPLAAQISTPSQVTPSPIPKAVLPLSPAESKAHARAQILATAAVVVRKQPQRRQRQQVVLGALLGLLLLGVGTVAVLRQGPREPARPGPVAEVRQVSPLPVAESLPPPQVTPVVAPAVHHPRQQLKPHKKIAEPATEQVAAAPTPQSVDAKFKEVRSEYDVFRKNFGRRLEDHWQQILQDAALGRRDQHVDEMLDQLRRDMRRVKSGG